MKKNFKPFLFFQKKLKYWAKNKNILFGSLFLTILFLAVYLIPFTPLYKNPDASSHYKRLQSISLKHLMGTDSTGHDLFNRMLEGTKKSLTIGFCSIMMASIIGTLLGIISGYFKNIFDNIINFICDILVVFPDVILAILIMFFLKENKKLSLIIALSISNAPTFIRIIRANTMKIRQKGFIKASKALGSNEFCIIFKHVLPHLWSIIITRITIGMATVILTISGLSFVGLGLDPTIPEWGNILNDSRSDIRFYPHLFFGPFIIILLTSLSFNLIGKGLIQIFNPKDAN
ncbi:MAG: ABC transporter permease [Candidatus Phytoplasma asteris]|uniref:ABC-type dipeptide/oligopeptide system, permease n=1 Tax='Chrysanthemum coronarium' phytoplasma TaxID=1520703 RepID=A0ABQ0J2P9_9MOLU|nr:ABC transporter permease ['Chrysanthemum coronarium' phytoplasma]TKA87604.1 MAG: ABC-type peptide/nickel transport system permease protein [Periwinkle leaf yellowing phytoplasma]WEX19963.1 MAG: ABC transporter permease [Candidatus Phytoplasma asteris]GAK73885.1 ABC-type dipeptide/oligopeptide system, permease ['Chrysanthemum coronarium' phytoplasma]